jgi:putative endonuclease
VYYVYILASRSRTLYTGVTNSADRRIAQHKQKLLEGFTRRYNIDRLVHLETFTSIVNAIAREKQIKGWTRAKKIALIEAENPTWEDLAADLGKPVPPLKPSDRVQTADPSSPISAPQDDALSENRFSIRGPHFQSTREKHVRKSTRNKQAAVTSR